MDQNKSIEIFIQKDLPLSCWGARIAQAMAQVDAPFRVNMFDSLNTPESQQGAYRLFLPGSKEECINPLTNETDNNNGRKMAFRDNEHFNTWVQDKPNFPLEVKQTIMAIHFGEDCEPNQDCVPGILCIDFPVTNSDENNGVTDPDPNLLDF